MTDEELRHALENFKHEAEQDFNADRMDILEGRGERGMKEHREAACQRAVSLCQCKDIV